MTLLILMYVIFIIGGIWLSWTKKAGKRDTTFFVSITTLGAVLWGSILLRHPLDANKAIAWLLQWQ